MRQGGQHPGAHERLVAGCDRGQHVAHHEHHHERHQGLPRREPQAERRQGGGADDDADGIGGDEQADGGHRDAEPVADLGEHPHDDELGGADAEGTNGKGEQCARHGRDSKGRGNAGGCAGGLRRPVVPGLLISSSRAARNRSRPCPDEAWVCSQERDRGAGLSPPRVQTARAGPDGAVRSPGRHPRRRPCPPEAVSTMTSAPRGERGRQPCRWGPAAVPSLRAQAWIPLDRAADRLFPGPFCPIEARRAHFQQMTAWRSRSVVPHPHCVE